MTRPRINQFGTFFKALHGYDPFPWQRRLATMILENGAWPDLLDIPTGLGKTSAIDVALFVLATRPEVAPRRIVLVVDRRVVVDQGADHARIIQRRLATATEGPLATVATALRELWGGPEGKAPFEVAVLRGGMPRDEAWVQRPDRPVIALSTVDQVGSRLLFRGYGVSAGMASVHAGLLGHDALILLDEVQLSTAFAETLGAIGERWRTWRERDHELGDALDGLPDRWAFVRMSATPLEAHSKDEGALTLDSEDLAHPVVEQRRGAIKLATLAEPIAASRTDSTKGLLAVVDAFASVAAQHLHSGATRLAVIVNRVATARAIHGELKRRVGTEADVVLLTGRMRPLDREDVFGDATQVGSVASRVLAGTPRTTDERPVIVVSTQTIEAGADFDFDALVTECASLDALRQRFGRLDRRGTLRETRATILIRKDDCADSKDDPVYGAALGNTWAWLESKAGKTRSVDFGIAGFPSLPKNLAELCSPTKQAPVMLPAHLDAWAQTNPRGEPDPDVALWLHGAQRGIPEVRVLWRADLNETALEGGDDTEVERYAAASLAVAPPSSLECISVPLPEFRAWIAKQKALAGDDLADVEGAGASGEPRARDPGPCRPFLVATKTGASVCRHVGEAQPEATLIVPSSYGGIRDGNWDPEATISVRDLGDWAQLRHRARPVLRLVPSLLAQWATDGVVAPPRIPESDDPDVKPRTAVREWLASTLDGMPTEVRIIAEALLEPKAKLRAIELAPSGYYYAAIGRRCPGMNIGALGRGDEGAADIVSDDDDSASHIGTEVELEQHLGDVAGWVRRFVENLNLPEAISGDLVLAARFHDLGKADPRFQQLLLGGSPVRLAASHHLLAKSRADVSDRIARDEARLLAGYPKGYRHELLSVAMLECANEALSKAQDRELVLHLVGSHHGWCRPFAPAVDHGPSLDVEATVGGIRFTADAAHGLASPDSGVAERYLLLTERYGWWTLAWFEALLRLADHRASEESEANAGSVSSRERPSIQKGGR